MKYQISVNQLMAIELGITNINQAIIFDMLTSVATWANPVILDNGEVYYWISRNKLSDDLWLLHLEQDTIYRHFKKLEELKLIVYKKQKRKDLIRITNLGQTYLIKPASHYIRFDEFTSYIEKNYIHKVIVETKDKESNHPIILSINDEKKLYNKITSELFKKSRSIEILKTLYEYEKSGKINLVKGEAKCTRPSYK